MTMNAKIPLNYKSVHLYPVYDIPSSGESLLVSQSTRNMLGWR